MFKKIAWALIVTLLCNGLTVYGQTKTEIKFKRQIVEIGTNQMIRVKLNSNEKLEGRIAEIRNDSFTLQLVDSTGQVGDKEIDYSELDKVSKMREKKAGNAFKRGVLIGVGIYVGMAAVALVAIGIASAAGR